MPAFTPNLNLYKPGGGSTGLITPDEVVDVDRFNANLDIIDSAVKAIQDRAAALEAQGGLVLCRPTGLGSTGGSINADGTVDPGTGTSIRIDGVFSSQFSTYKVLCYGAFSAGVGGMVMELSSGGTILGSAGSYTWGGMGINNSTTVTGYHDNNAGNIRLSPGNGNQFNIEITVMQPMTPGRRCIVRVQTYGQNVTTQSFSYFGGGGTQATTGNWDGIRINPGSNFSFGNIAVYGVAGAAL